MEANVKITAQVRNSRGDHRVMLATDGTTHVIDIPPRESGFGSSANGGELLFLALATCYCNDIYREAAKRGIVVESVEVNVEGQFGAAGEPAKDISYRAKVVAQATDLEIQELMRHTDTVSEIQNTLRTQIPVTLIMQS
jgi:organic hydroperoxide reductase OsmC/OhrA